MSTQTQVQGDVNVRENLRQVLEAYRSNMGKVVNVPAERGEGTITVKCDKTALDLVVDEVKLRSTGKQFILPDATKVSEKDFKSAKTILQDLKRSVRMFQTLGVDSSILPTWERKTRSSKTDVLTPIEDVEAYLDNLLK